MTDQEKLAAAETELATIRQRVEHVTQTFRTEKDALTNRVAELSEALAAANQAAAQQKKAHDEQHKIMQAQVTESVGHGQKVFAGIQQWLAGELAALVDKLKKAQFPDLETSKEAARVNEIAKMEARLVQLKAKNGSVDIGLGQ